MNQNDSLLLDLENNLIKIFYVQFVLWLILNLIQNTVLHI